MTAKRPMSSASVSPREAEYTGVRANPLRFVVAPGHLDPVVDRLVESTDSCAVVEKIALAAVEADHKPTLEASG